MNLSIVMKCQQDIIEDVRDSIDRIYVKQQMILESCQDYDMINNYACFQEGFLSPGSSKELDMFKFDNKHIIKAIKHFNKAWSNIKFSKEFDEAKKEQEKGNLDIKNIIDPLGNSKYIPAADVGNEFKKPNGEFLKGLNELEKQFDCNFTISLSYSHGTGTQFPDNPGKLTISRSKGFQLGGLQIKMNINPEDVVVLSPAKKEVFGQFLVSVILHEIYHNICHMMEIRNKKLHADIKSTITKAGESSNIISSTSIISSFIERFTGMFNIKKGDIDKKQTLNRMYVLSQIKGNVAAMNQFEEDIKGNKDPTNKDKDLDAYIQKMLTLKKMANIGKGSKIVAIACSILLAGIGVAIGSTTAVVASSVCMAIMALSMIIKKVKSLFMASPTVKEEYFCDLFAAMYQLPIHLSSFNRQIALNKKHVDKVKKIRKIEQDIDKSQKDVHPLDFDREVTSYKIAKQILNSGQRLKPAVKEYLKYIVDLHDGIEDIDNPTSKRQAKKLDPEAAKDLKKTLNDFVAKTGAVVTESFIDDFVNGVIYYA